MISLSDDYDLYQENQVNKLVNTRRKKKLKKRFKFLIFLAIVGVIVGYFISDLSKVHSIKVTGNEVISSDTIKEASTLDSSTIYLLINRSKVIESIESLPFISDAKISYGILGNVTIKVEETDKTAYCEIDDVTYVIDEYGKVASTDDEEIKTKLKSCVKLSEFEDVEFLEEFAKEYAEIPDIIKDNTSDVIYAPKDADETRVRFILNSGKELILRVEDMVEELEAFPYEAYMSEYDNICTFDFYGSNIYMTPCDE